ncbi:MAG: ABC transporter permease [Myxococcota bacterium]|nr:ABC transporter permease [Myxococcota bacterium]
MNATSTVRIALRSMWSNKMRALLTTLGVLIGVGALIAITAIGAGAKANVEHVFASMGTNLVIVLPGSTGMGGVNGGFGSMPTLTWDDVAAIRRDLASVEAVAPELRANVPVIAGDQNWTTSLTGTSPEFFEMRNWPMTRGEPLLQADVDAAAKAIILGQTLVDRLYGQYADPIDQIVRVGSTPFRVVGIAARKGQSAIGQDLDDAAFVPYTTFAQRIQGGMGAYLKGSLLVASRPGDTVQVENDITVLLRDRHRLPPEREDDFSVHDMSELAAAQEQGTETMTMLLAAVALVSLVVGGIGIMNIMLVSVTERTREIGIRMALGAQPRHILLQFLVEALALSVAGGLLGIACGVATAASVAERLHWPIRVQPAVVAVSVVFSALVGVVFGLYPARKASAVDPIDALRFE